jgi:hypothetical protein
VPLPCISKWISRYIPAPRRLLPVRGTSDLSQTSPSLVQPSLTQQRSLLAKMGALLMLALIIRLRYLADFVMGDDGI